MKWKRFLRPRVNSPPCPPRADAARPLGAQSSSCPPAGCALHRTLASDSPRPGPRVADPRWPSAVRCPSASWKGRTCPPRTCERGRGWEPQLSGEGRCPLCLTFPGSPRPPTSRAEARVWRAGPQWETGREMGTVRFAASSLQGGTGKGRGLGRGRGL